MELQVVDTEGQGVGNVISISEETFARSFNEALVHQVVVAHLAGARAGTRAQKSRSDVSGGGAKPWRQKGTGRARAGSIRSPLWRGGGITFAARPQDHSQKVNKKMYRAAMRSIFSELIRQDRLIVVRGFEIAEPKTKRMVAYLAQLGVEGNILLVAEELDSKLVLSARNLPKVDTIEVRKLNPVDLLRSDKVVITVAALEHVKEWLA